MADCLAVVYRVMLRRGEKGSKHGRPRKRGREGGRGWLDGVVGVPWWGEVRSAGGGEDLRRE